MRAVFTILTLCATLGLASASRGAPSVQPQPHEQRDSITSNPIYFRIGSDAVDLSFERNQEALTKLGALLTDTTILARMDSVRITATASPDGNYTSNQRLADQRAHSIKSYIGQYYPRIESNKITTHSSVESWQLLRPMISADHTPYYGQILAVLDQHLPSQSIEAQLRAIGGGRAWSQIMRDYLPQMRSVATCVIYTSRMIPDVKVVAPTPEPVKVIEPEPISELMPIVEEVIFIAPIESRRPLFALKTNLLYDAVTALNIEIEIPIGRRWSVAGEYIFPWWLSSSKQHCIQSLSGYLEGRYWFGDRIERRQLTGWFMGLYVGAGYYDMEWDHKGYQGEFFIPLALSGGYTHSIGRNLSMEYSLGVGYMQTNYRKYEATPCHDGDIHLVCQRRGTHRWFGPTRVKVSLVWMINAKTRR